MADRTTEEEALEKLRTVISRGEATIFSKEEVEVLRDVIRVYRGIRAFGWLGSALRNIILITMTILGAYAALSGAFEDWIKRIVGGP